MPAQLTVSGAAGQNGRPAPEHAALVRRNVPERVRTHDQQMEVKTVQELEMKLENAAIEFVQWMANGVIGKIGHHVRPRVELEHRNVSARVPSHAQLLAGKIALVLVGRANHVKEYPVQWTADGLIGKTGHCVRGRVGLDRRNVCVLVPNHDQLLAGKIALVSVGKPSRAKRELVQLMDSGASGNSGLNAPELVVVEFKHVLARAQDPAPPTVEKIVSVAEMRLDHVALTLAQWMATGRSGQNGENVPGLVAADSTHALEPVPIPHPGTAEKIALGNPMKLVPVALSLVQWMASGVAGPFGLHAQNHVVKASKRELVPVQIHHQPMEETNALVKLNRRRVVTLSLVQGALKSLTLPSWWMHPKA